MIPVGAMPRSSRSDSRPEPGFTRNVSTTGGPAARIAARRLTRCRPPAIQSSLPIAKTPSLSPGGVPASLVGGRGGLRASSRSVGPGVTGTASV